MSAPTRFSTILSWQNRANTEFQGHPFVKELQDVLDHIRRERVLQQEALELFLERTSGELKHVVETAIRAGTKLSFAESMPRSPKSPTLSQGPTPFIRKVRTCGDLHKALPEHTKTQDGAPLPERTNLQRFGSKNSTCSKRGFFRSNLGSGNGELPRTLSQNISEQKENENREWRDHIRKSVTRRLELAAKTNGPVEQLTTYFGLAPRSQSIIGMDDSGGEAGRGNCAGRIVSNAWFNVAVALVILVNAILIGLEAEAAAAHAIDTYYDGTCDAQGCDYIEPMWYQIVEIILLVLMILEVGARFFSGKRTFLIGVDWKWNVFDVLLLAASIWEKLSDIQAFSHFRILRGLRMIRVLRIIRVVRLFRELRLMVCSIAHSLWSLTWAVGILLVGIYLVAVCFMYGVTAYINDGENNDLRKKLIDWYGSIWSTMWMLLLSVTGGIDWEQAVAPLRVVHPLYPPVFALYVCFVLIGVLNTFTSVFVEQARQFGKVDRDLIIHTELAQNEAFMCEMRQIFEEVDCDRSGIITWSQFQRYLENERVQAYFAIHKLDTSQAHELFHMLSDGSVEGVELEEFIMGCMRLKGQAKQGDLAILLREHKILNRKVRQFVRLIESHLGLHPEHRIRAVSQAASQLSQLSEHDWFFAPKEAPSKPGWEESRMQEDDHLPPLSETTSRSEWI